MTKRSEGQAWDNVEEIGASLQASTQPWVRELGKELQAMAAEMRGQLRKGVHTNPLVIYGNPPMKVKGKYPEDFDRIMSHRVYEVRYRHIDDNRDYKHEFGPGVDMWAVVSRLDRLHQIVLSHIDGKPLWNDFE